ncbi:MAG: response regulator [Elusimicrobia bacterium]|nr:response regulator [Elusimicrobiota bacterium]
MGWARLGSETAIEAQAPVAAAKGAWSGDIGTVTVRLSGTRLRREFLGRVGAGLLFAGLLLSAAVTFLWVLMTHFLAPIARILRADAEAGPIPPGEVPDDEIGTIMLSRAEMLFKLRLAEGQARALAVSEGHRADELGRALEELRQAKESLARSEKLAALGRVLAGVAHELNNPLTGILGYAQLLLEDEALSTAPAARADLERVLAEARRCQRVVADLCAFSRGQKPVKARIRLEDPVRGAVSAERPRLEAAGVLVREEYGPEPGFVLADAAQLERCVINLLVNARHALEKSKGGLVTVRVLARGGRLRVEVEDEGAGLSPETEARLFEPFFSTKPLGKGTGLGLAIVRGIMESHGGRALFERPSAGGARFILEFEPAFESAAGSPAQAPEPGAAARLPSGGLCVLVVDDEAEVRSVLLRMLERLGHRPDAAVDADEALRLLAAGSYDCVLSDIRMPGRDGFELFAEAIELRPELKGKWAFVTGSIEADTWRRVQETGRPALQKPFASEEVARVLAGLA